jgi:hypothetical protein
MVEFSILPQNLATADYIQNNYCTSSSVLIYLHVKIFQFRSSCLNFMSNLNKFLSSLYLIAQHQSGCTIFYKVKVTLLSPHYAPRVVFFTTQLVKSSSRAGHIIGDTAGAEETREI